MTGDAQMGKNNPTLADFKRGYHRFREHFKAGEWEAYRRLAVAQTPRAMIVACADSRVDPAVITDCGPGELFTVRNVTGIVPPYRPDMEDHGISYGVGAALEYAVTVLRVSGVIAMGHARCGGIQTLLAGGCGGELIDPWVSLVERARQIALRRCPPDDPEALARTCEQAAVCISLENLTTYPWVRDAIAEDRLTLTGWYFDIWEGRLHEYNTATDRFDAI